MPYYAPPIPGPTGATGPTGPQGPQGDPGPAGIDGTSNGLLTGGGVFWTGGLNYTVSAATYIIGGVSYSSPQANLSLTSADPTNDRIDSIVVDSTGAASVLTGTPAPVPLAPNLDPSSQLQLTIAYIPAGSATPSNVSNENIYLENTEYTSSTNASGHFALASTNNPFQGSKDIEATGAVGGNFVTLVKPSGGTLNLSLYTTLTIYIRSKAVWPNAKTLSVFWLSGTTVIGNPVAIKYLNTFGFDSSITANYQQVTIQVSSFATGVTLVDRLRISVAGGSSAIGFYLDSIILQGGTSGSGGGIVAGVPARASVTISAASIASLTRSQGTITTARTLDIIAVVSNNAHPVRIRLYSSSAARTADLTRSCFSPPLSQTQHQVIMDLILNATTGYTWIMSPIARGSNSTGDQTFYYTLDNLDASTQSLNVTLTYLKAE